MRLTCFSAGVPGPSAWMRALWGFLVARRMPHHRERIVRLDRVFVHPSAPLLTGVGFFCRNPDPFVDDLFAGRFTEPTGHHRLPRVHAGDVGPLDLPVGRGRGPDHPGVGVRPPPSAGGPAAARAMLRPRRRSPRVYALTIILEPKPGQERSLLDACLATVAPSRAEPGNLFFDVLVSDSGREVVFYEAYVDEAAFQAHMASPHTRAWQEAALPSIERSTLRFPAHRSVAPAPRRPGAGPG